MRPRHILSYLHGRTTELQCPMYFSQATIRHGTTRRSTAVLGVHCTSPVAGLVGHGPSLFAVVA